MNKRTLMSTCLSFAVMFVLLISTTAMAANPARAQGEDMITVGYNELGVSFSPLVARNVNINVFAGDPPTLEQPGGPEVKHTEFVLYTRATEQEPPPSSFDAPGVIRIYKTADFARYDFPTQRLKALQDLLGKKPDLGVYMTDKTQDELPFMPVYPAAQVIRAQAKYIDVPAYKGVSYITVFRQDVSPFVGSEFLFTFQGLTNDGAYYITAIFRLETKLFPAEIGNDFNYDSFSKTFPQYLKDSVARLNGGTAADFTPNLGLLDAAVKTFTFKKAV